MDRNLYSTPLSLRAVKVNDSFWKQEMELVRKEVIPYQWEALNDRVKGADPSFCMRNFKVAAAMNRKKKELGSAYVEPVYTNRGFNALPEDPEHPDDDKFYGFVFQDTDFSKWIEAVGYCLTQHPDENLERVADGAIDIVCDAQQEDGYLDTYYIINGRDKTFSNLRDHHELYCFGHLTEGAVAYYQATGKDKLLKAAERFADYIAECFGNEEGKIKGYPGHEIAEMALIRLYEVTGNDKYYELSRFFVEQRGRRPYYFDSEHPEAVVKGKEREERYHYHQAHRPVREQDEAVGHAVRAVYLYSGMADVARISGDKTLYEACERLWDSIVERKMYITGGIGATHIGEAFSFDYDLPNDTVYAETCASIGMAFFARRMLEIEPKSKYADVMERELYNTVISGMARDGKSFFYVNPLEVNPVACRRDERKYHIKPVRQKWFGCACCPPNIARIVSSISNYAFTENDDTLFVHLYVGSEIEKRIGDDTVKVSIDTNMPWEGNVKISVKAKDTDFILAVRIPEWASDYGLNISDAQTNIKDGYLYITKDWTDEDIIDITFALEVGIMEADGKIREDIGKVAVTRGPIVYCLESVDNGNAIHMLSVKIDSKPEEKPIEIVGNKAVGIEVDGYRRQLKTDEKGLYRQATVPVKDEVKLKFIPYYMWANRGENEMQVWTRADY